MTSNPSKNIHKYEAPWIIYGMHWSTRPHPKKFRLALGSFIEEYNNKVQIVSLDETTSNFTARCQFEHPYPTTKISWIPDKAGVLPDLLATAGDYLRIWQVDPTNDPDTDRVQELALLNDTISSGSDNNQEYCAPLTSFDWNEVDPNILGTSSIDTTCTIWNIDTGQALAKTKPTGIHPHSQHSQPTSSNQILKYGLGQTIQTKLIAHDKEVYDIAFCTGERGRESFASVGNDGSVRLFDLRCLEHSTIVYESDFTQMNYNQHRNTNSPGMSGMNSSNNNKVGGLTHKLNDDGLGTSTSNSSGTANMTTVTKEIRRPLLRLAWNKQDSNYIATMPLDSTEIIILDIRFPCTPLTQLNDHRGFVNDMAWAPHTSCHICTAGDDSQALIWDISKQNHDSNKLQSNKDEPLLSYQASGEINKVHWSHSQTDWIAVCYDQTLEILRV